MDRTRDASIFRKAATEQFFSVMINGQRLSEKTLGYRSDRALWHSFSGCFVLLSVTSTNYDQIESYSIWSFSNNTYVDPKHLLHFFVIYVETDLGCVLSSGHESSLPPLRDGASPGVKLPGLELQITEAPQRQLKAQKRRVPPTSKVGNFFTFKKRTTGFEKYKNMELKV